MQAKHTLVTSESGMASSSLTELLRVNELVTVFDRCGKPTGLVGVDISDNLGILFLTPQDPIPCSSVRLGRKIAECLGMTKGNVNTV